MDTKDIRQIEAWKASANLAEIRNEPVRAWILRTMAYELQYGSLNLDADQTQRQDSNLKKTVNA